MNNANHQLELIRKRHNREEFAGYMIFFALLLMCFVMGCYKDQDPDPYYRFLCIEIEGESSLYCCPEGSKDDAECWLEDREPVAE